MTKEELVVIAREMPVDDQAYIVAELGTAVTSTVAADGWSPTVPPDLRAELERRMVAYDADPTRGIPLERFKARVQAEG